MPYDLYGTHYASRRDAENAEMAQVASIDADIAMREVEELKRQLHSQQQPSSHDEEMINLWQYIKELELRICYLEQANKI